jgi:hypothetical protein
MAAMIDFFSLGLAMLTGFYHLFLMGLPGMLLIGFWLGGEVRLGHRCASSSTSAKRCFAA